jgi:hypothetical protein
MQSQVNFPDRLSHTARLAWRGVLTLKAVSISANLASEPARFNLAPHVPQIALMAIFFAFLIVTVIDPGLGVFGIRHLQQKSSPSGQARLRAAWRNLNQVLS